MTNPILISIVRTVVPVIVGFIGTVAVKVGLEIDDTTLVASLTSLITVAYYVVARELEVRFSWAGRLLGVNSQPSYDVGG